MGLAHDRERIALANDLVKLEKFGNVYVLTLLGGGPHFFSDPLFEAIIGPLTTAKNTDDTNKEKFFSNGLDLQWVEKKRSDESLANGFRNRYSELLATVLSMNVPTIAAICGHACAGGLIYALAHDHRCMRGDRGFLYMSEMDVKVRIPPSAMSVVRTALSPKAFKDTVLLARRHTAMEGLGAGLVDSVHEGAANTLKAAISWGQNLHDRGWSKEFYRNARLDMKPRLLEGSKADIDSPSSFPVHATLKCKM